MRTASVLCFVLGLAGGAVLGILGWQYWNQSVSANYQPAFLSADAQAFLEECYEFLQHQMELDNQAIGRAGVSTVRAFARSAFADHQADLRRLADLAAKVQAPMQFNTATPNGPDGNPQSDHFDRQYLDKVIDEHQRRLARIREEVPMLESTPLLASFASMRIATLERHLNQARMVRDGLTDTASLQPILLLVATTCFLTTLAIRLRRAGRLHAA